MSWTSFIAFRYFRSYKKDKFVNLATKISIVTSTIAVAFLIISFSIFRGYKDALIEKITKSSGHVVITDSEPFDYKELEPILNKVKTEKIVEASGLITCGPTSTSVYLYASSCASLKNIDSTHIPISVSKNLADLMHYKPTDIITIIVPIVAPAPFFILPESVTCEIVKIQKFESEDLSQNGVLMNLVDLQGVLGCVGKIQKVKCFFDLKSADHQYQMLNKAVSKKFVFHWKDLNEFVLKVMKSEQNVFMLLLFMLIILASLLYLLAIGMFINSKKNDITILKILGATNRNISSVFFKYSLIIALTNVFVGSILGVLIGYNINNLVKFLERFFKITLFAEDVYLINYIPIQFHLMDFLAIVFSTFFISIISGFWISRKISSSSSL
ncbi:ABC transporter permease [Alphaproteobacteria bacterium endosymbiont of Tiliacea citrago]|uniref:ABC transporter permease n=1 Tax=Alphaproteobacteria bacterium endosymbiont of Tiliacea citrago TaxID=3077944 RepID=UPI00313AAAC4